MGKVKGEHESSPYLPVQRRRSGIVSSDLFRESEPKSRRQHGELSHIDITVHCNRPRGYRFFIYNPAEERGFLHDIVEGQSRVFLATARALGKREICGNAKIRSRPRDKTKIASRYRFIRKLSRRIAKINCEIKIFTCCNSIALRLWAGIILLRSGYTLLARDRLFCARIGGLVCFEQQFLIYSYNPHLLSVCFSRWSRN